MRKKRFFPFEKVAQFEGFFKKTKKTFLISPFHQLTTAAMDHHQNVVTKGFYSGSKGAEIILVCLFKLGGRWALLKAQKSIN